VFEALHPVNIKIRKNIFRRWDFVEYQPLDPGAVPSGDSEGLTRPELREEIPGISSNTRQDLSGTF